MTKLDQTALFYGESGSAKWSVRSWHTSFVERVYSARRFHSPYWGDENSGRTETGRLTTCPAQTTTRVRLAWPAVGPTHDDRHPTLLTGPPWRSCPCLNYNTAHTSTDYVAHRLVSVILRFCSADYLAFNRTVSILAWICRRRFECFKKVYKLS